MEEAPHPPQLVAFVQQMRRASWRVGTVTFVEIIGEGMGELGNMLFKMNANMSNKYRVCRHLHHASGQCAVNHLRLNADGQYKEVSYRMKK